MVKGKGRVGGWFQLAASGNPPNSTGAFMVDVGGIMEADLGRQFAGDTVVRTRGTVTLESSSLTSGDHWVFLVNARKGLTSGDLDDFDSDSFGFMWALEVRQALLTRETSAGVFTAMSYVYQLDTKAKRIINLGETFYIVGYSSLGSAVSIFVRGRCLIKLR